MAGYLTQVTRDEVAESPTVGEITALDILNYVDGTPSRPRGIETVFTDSELFETPIITSGLSIDIVIEDDALETASNNDFRTIFTDNIVAYLSTFGTNSFGQNIGNIGALGLETVDLNTEFLNQMSAQPGQYSSDGLTAWRTTTSFAKGDALNTNNKIRNFATEVLHDLIIDWRADADAWVNL